MNSKSMFRLCFHLFSAVMYFCALVRYEYLPPMPHTRSHEEYAGRFKYLTYWNLIVQCLFFVHSCIIDLMKPTTASYNKTTRIRDKFYGGILMPYGVFVFVMFWGLYAIDRELIFPKVIDGIFPVWLNHVSHTVILPVLLIETYIIKHRHPRRKEGLTFALGFGFFYMVWILFLALAKDIWVYPFLRILNWTQRLIFFGLSIIMQYFMYLTGEKINCFFWGQSVVWKTK